MANTIKSYLHNAHRGSMPDWLEQFQKGDRFDPNDFFGSRIVFYPGYGNDGQAVRLFGGSGSAHVFIYADYAVSRERLIARLESADNHFTGYDVLDILNLEQHELVPDGWVTTLHRDTLSAASKAMSSVEPFGMITILERKNGFEQNHGPKRLAILFLGADGIATYDALFCQPHKKIEPFGLCIQDHGLGGNYSSFGRDGLMHKIACEANIFPQFILSQKFEDQGCVWRDYELIEGLDYDLGGIHANERFLFRKR